MSELPDKYEIATAFDTFGELPWKKTPGLDQIAATIADPNELHAAKLGYLTFIESLKDVTPAANEGAKMEGNVITIEGRRLLQYMVQQFSADFNGCDQYRGPGMQR